MAVNVLDFVETHHLLSFQESDFRESTEAANENHEGYYTVELLITHSLIWEFKGLFNSKFPNSIMHYEQFDCSAKKTKTGNSRD